MVSLASALDGQLLEDKDDISPILTFISTARAIESCGRLNKILSLKYAIQTFRFVFFILPELASSKKWLHTYCSACFMKILVFLLVM